MKLPRHVTGKTFDQSYHTKHHPNNLDSVPAETFRRVIEFSAVSSCSVYLCEEGQVQCRSTTQEFVPLRDVQGFSECNSTTSWLFLKTFVKAVMNSDLHSQYFNGTDGRNVAFHTEDQQFGIWFVTLDSMTDWNFIFATRGVDRCNCILGFRVDKIVNSNDIDDRSLQSARLKQYRNNWNSRFSFYPSHVNDLDAESLDTKHILAQLQQSILSGIRVLSSREHLIHWCTGQSPAVIRHISVFYKQIVRPSKIAETYKRASEVSGIIDKNSWVSDITMY